MKSLPDFFSFKTLTMQKFAKADTAEAVALINQAFEYQVAHVGHNRTDPTLINEKAAKGDLHIIKDGAKIVATIFTKHTGDAVKFGMFAIAPTHRGSGLSTAMLAALDQYAKAVGAKTINLDYTSFAPWLKTYYQRHGYTETGEREPWDGAELVHMQKTIG